MILAHWRARRANRVLIDQLHGRIVAAARRPALYVEFGVPDRYDGRFEMVTLYAGLALRRLTRLSGIGTEIAEELANSVFRHFEVALREIGVGDVAVPRRLKQMAEAFYGRNKAYAAALDDDDLDRLAAALARNVYGIADASGAPAVARLARLVRATAEALDRTPLETFARGEAEFPEPTDALVGGEAGRG